MLRLLVAMIVVALVGSCAKPVPPAQPDDFPGAVIGTEDLGGSDSLTASAARRVTYVSKTGVNDAYTHVTASIYVPRGSAPPGGFPVVVYGRAVGAGSPVCAFSSAAAKRTSSAAIGAFLAAGYVVAVPDYQGLGNTSDGWVRHNSTDGKPVGHPYLDSTSAGYNMLDAVRATRTLFPATAPVWSAVGEAHGGQAAWAANELSEEYGAPGLRGTVSVSPTADVDGLPDAAASGTLAPAQQRMYIEYLAALESEYRSGFSLDDYRRGVVKDNWSLLLGCDSEHDEALRSVTARIGPDDLRPATPQALSLLRGYLRKTSLPLGPAKAPMLVVFGKDDPLIPAGWTTRAVVRACGIGDSVTVREQSSPAVSDPAVLAWMAGRFAGTAARDDCPSFVAANPPAPQVDSGPTTAAAGPSVQVEPPAPAAGLSLLRGWLPLAVYGLAVAALLVAVGRRSRRWWMRRLPVAFAFGAALIAAVRWFFDRQGWGPNYPWPMWPWLGLAGVAAGVLVLGWPGSPWWRRTVAVLAVPLCLLATATATNASLGYLPTVTAAWLRVSGKQPAQWIDQTKLAALQRNGARPASGTVVTVRTPDDVSGFTHRDELVYLPPVWFRASPPPRLPVVMVIGPEFSTPRDWLLYGRQLDVLDEFVRRHGGAAPVVVFPDTSGSFTNDTECVNGPRGNAADHVVREFVPYVIANFGVAAEASHWGVTGWSSGGTCSIMFLVRHPELFGAAVDLDGQLGPNAGPRDQTIARLFGGDADAWAAFDPRSVVADHGPYRDKAVWVGVSGDVPDRHFPPGDRPLSAAALPDWDNHSEDHAKTAAQLCELLSSSGIECSVSGYPGGHDYPSAATGFAAALPWLAGRIGTPSIPQIPLPGA